MLEEKYFWPAVREHHPAGDTLADTATGQEQEAKQVLDKLGKLDPGDEEFEKLLGSFIADAREHIAFGGSGVAGDADRAAQRQGRGDRHQDR